MIFWCHNAKTGEIFSYKQESELTDFPRGTLLAYDDYLTTGFKSKEEAQEWAKVWGCCEKCRSSKTANKNGRCTVCNSKIVFRPVKVVANG